MVSGPARDFQRLLVDPRTIINPRHDRQTDCFGQTACVMNRGLETDDWSDGWIVLKSSSAPLRHHRRETLWLTVEKHIGHYRLIDHVADFCAPWNSCFYCTARLCFYFRSLFCSFRPSGRVGTGLWGPWCFSPPSPTHKHTRTLRIQISEVLYCIVFKKSPAYE